MWSAQRVRGVSEGDSRMLVILSWSFWLVCSIFLFLFGGGATQSGMVVDGDKTWRLHKY